MGSSDGDGPVRAGDPRERAIPRLLQQHGGQLYGLATRLCGNPEDAADLVQETFLNAYRSWGQFKQRGDPQAWLFRIATRACQRMHRRRVGEGRSATSLDGMSPFNEPTMAALPGVSRGRAAEKQLELLAAVQQAIVALPLRYRLPLVLKDIVNLSIPQAATALGLKERALSSRVHRARLYVRRHVIDQLPQVEAPPPAYARKVCLDLLAAKQAALDRGVPFPVTQELACERCRSVFSTLDLGCHLCARLGRAGPLPRAVEQSVLNKLA